MGPAGNPVYDRMLYATRHLVIQDPLEESFLEFATMVEIGTRFLLNALA